VQPNYRAGMDLPGPLCRHQAWRQAEPCEAADNSRRLSRREHYLGARHMPLRCRESAKGCRTGYRASLPSGTTIATIGRGVLQGDNQRMSPELRLLPLRFQRLAPEEQVAALDAFAERLTTRRTVRQFSEEPVAEALIDRAIAVAGSAPSGANLQPWRFVVVRDRDVKRRIREAAEAEERAFYERRATEEWLDALRPLGTDWRKEFLEVAPLLIVVFRIDYAIMRDASGAERHRKHYYVAESVGIACGLLLAALHVAGLATLTHTPSPMGFLSSILQRPKNEKPYLLLPVGFPAPDAQVPDIGRKSLDEIRLRV
jgi:iodotyrosine deiodinase